MNRKMILAGIDGIRDLSGVVYVATFPNGKKYVGVTIQKFVTRMREHERKSAVKTSKLSYAIQKYGKEVIDWEVVFKSKKLDELHRVEKGLISELNTIVNGYNIAEGGQGAQGVVRSEAFKIKQKIIKTAYYKNQSNREKISIATKNAYIDNPNQAINHSKKMKLLFQCEERRRSTSAKTSAYLSDPVNLIKHSIERGANEFWVYKDGARVAAFLTQHECARTLGLSVSHINQCLKGKRKTHGGYKFEFKNK